MLAKDIHQCVPTVMIIHNSHKSSLNLKGGPQKLGLVLRFITYAKNSTFAKTPKLGKYSFRFEDSSSLSKLAALMVSR